MDTTVFEVSLRTVVEDDVAKTWMTSSISVGFSDEELFRVKLLPDTEAILLLDVAPVLVELPEVTVFPEVLGQFLGLILPSSGRQPSEPLNQVYKMLVIWGDGPFRINVN